MANKQSHTTVQATRRYWCIDDVSDCHLCEKKGDILVKKMDVDIDEQEEVCCLCPECSGYGVVFKHGESV